MKESLIGYPPELDGINEEPDPNDACVANTIVSICSKLSGKDFKVPTIYYSWRGMMIKDMVRMYAHHEKRRQRNGLEGKSRNYYDAALHKLDQQSVVKFINTARDGRGIPLEAALIQTVLQDSEIEYRRGGMEDIMNEITLGRQIAASYVITNEEGDAGWHIAHIGLDHEKNLISFSDGNRLLQPQELESINNAATYLNSEAHTWNFVSVRKTGD